MTKAEEDHKELSNFYIRKVNVRCFKTRVGGGEKHNSQILFRNSFLAKSLAT